MSPFSVSSVLILCIFVVLVQCKIRLEPGTVVVGNDLEIKQNLRSSSLKTQTETNIMDQDTVERMIRDILMAQSLAFGDLNVVHKFPDIDGYTAPSNDADMTMLASGELPWILCISGNVHVYNVESLTWSSSSADLYSMATYFVGRDSNDVETLYSYAGRGLLLRTSDLRSLSVSSILDSDASFSIDSTYGAAREKASSVVHNNVAYIYGGQTSTGVLDDFSAYDIVENTWYDLTPPPSNPRLFYSSMFVDEQLNRLYIVGGKNSLDVSDTAYIMDLDTNDWTTSSKFSSLEIIRPVTVRFRRKIYLFPYLESEEYYIIFDLDSQTVETKNKTLSDRPIPNGLNIGGVAYQNMIVFCSAGQCASVYI